VTAEVNLRFLKPRVFARDMSRERPETMNMGRVRDAVAGRQAGAGMP